ncbi:MAG: ABC transporter permease, partial [Rhodobiaceae bacterium]|nr:ABC transporter permease [Rhodobiaceae bacterium]
AFLINMILSRLIALEREQIGLFKAIGYSNRAVAMHYIKLVIAISFVGILIGFGFGTWLGRGLFRLYGDFYHFPFLIFRTHVDIYLIAAGISLAAAVAGGIRAVWGAVRLPPAVAMRPPSPTVYRKLLSERLGLLKPFSRLTVMGLRHLIRHPLRSGMTALGTAFAVGLLAVSMVFNDVTAYLIDWVYYQSERQNAAVAFTSDAGPDALQAVARLPGVMKAEPGRSALATLRFGHRQRRLSIAGKVPDATLSRVLDDKGRPVVIADAGLTLTERVANILGARPGDMIQVEFMQGKRRQAL